MKKLLLGLLCSISAVAQVPTNATPVTLTQVGTGDCITTYSFVDSAGKTMYLQAYTCVTLFSPQTTNNMLVMVKPAAVYTIAPVAPPSASPSADGTIVKNNDGNVIVDTHGDKWGVKNAQVYINGDVFAGTSGVVELEYKSSTIWQLNTANNWYYWNDPAQAWDGGVGPS